MVRSLKTSMFGAVLSAMYCLSPGTALAAAPQVGPLLTFGFLPAVQPLERPLLARASTGAFVVSWRLTAADGSSTRMAQTFDANGVAASQPFQVNDLKTAYDYPALAMDANGNVIAAWRDSGAIRAQRYDLSGTPQGRTLLVASGSSGLLSPPTPLWLAVDADGNFVVTWTQLHDLTVPTLPPLTVSITESSNTVAKQYSAAGRLKRWVTLDKVAPKTFKTSYHSGHFNCDLLQGVAMNSGGELVLIYDVWRDNAQQPASAQRLDATLHTETPLAALNEVGVGYQDVGIDASGNFAVASRDFNGGALSAVRYDSSAHLLATIGPIAPGSDAAAPSTLSMQPSGAFVVTSQVRLFRDNGDGSSTLMFAKHGQYFNADGSPKSDDFVIDDSSGQIDAYQTSAAIDAAGNLIETWEVGDQFANGPFPVVGRLVTAP